MPANLLEALYTYSENVQCSTASSIAATVLKRPARLHSYLQALAAEFPNAALVRPVYENLANVYDLLRVRRRSCKSTVPAGKYGQERGEEKGGDNTRVPFEGRLLVFRRGNGVEETTGRLVLKKLDYLQVLLGLGVS